MAKENGAVKEKKQPTIADILAKYNITVVKEYEDTSRLPSGSLMLDRALGGGWPRGRISELWGEEHNGKSLITMLTMGRTLINGGSVVLLDMENAFDKTWAGNFIDLSNPNFVVTHQNANTYGEEILNMIHRLSENGIDLIVLDSKDSLVFGAEVEGETGSSFMGIRSQRFSHFARRLAQILGDTDTTVLLISQARDNIGDQWHPVTTSGGRALRHAYAIKVQMMTPKKIEETREGKTEIVGSAYNARTTKNNTYENFKTAAIRVRSFDTVEGKTWICDTAFEVWDLGLELGLFTLADGSPYAGAGNAHYNGELLGSKNVAISRLRAEPTMCFQIEQAIRSKLGWV